MVGVADDLIGSVGGVATVGITAADEWVAVSGWSVMAGMLPWQGGITGDDELARTGAGAVVLPLVVAGLLSLLLSGLLLRRRRSS